ncbi:MAG: xylulokinase [Anaerolineae bacterium]|nr:xylulokinase [Anaerolineae bacterium]
MTPLLLGIDVGTSNVKALLTTPEGAIIAQASEPLPLLTPRPGWVEQDPTAWWRATCAVIQRVVQQANLSADHIAGVGISGQGCAATLLDQHGDPIRPAIIWMDARSGAECEAMHARAGNAILAINGKQPAPYNFDPKLIWMMQHEPEHIERACHCLTTTGYINFRLTGEPVLNVSDASIPFAFDQASCDWSETLIEAFGIPRHLYPRVARCQDIIGQVTPAAAAATGLRVGTPVIAGGEDTSAAGMSVGVVRPGQAMLSLGTGGSIYIAQSSPIAHPQLLTFAHVLQHQWFVGGTIVAFGASLAWCRDLLGHTDYNAMTALASECQAGAHGLLFLPYLSGELQPINDGNARGVFFGLSLTTHQPQLIRAVMEGVAFSMAHNILVATEVGATSTELRAVGGPTKSPLWCQIIADICRQPLVVLANSAGAPLGDALLASAALGLIPDAGEAAAKVAEVAHIYQPDPATAEVYDRLFMVYRQLYPQLKHSFAAVAQM